MSSFNHSLWQCTPGTYLDEECSPHSPLNLFLFTLKLCPFVLSTSDMEKGFLQYTLSVAIIILYTSIITSSAPGGTDLQSLLITKLLHLRQHPGISTLHFLHCYHVFLLPSWPAPYLCLQCLDYWGLVCLPGHLI